MNKLRCLRLALPVLLALVCLPAYGQRYEIGPYFSFDRMSRKPLGTVRQTGGTDGDTHFGDGKAFGARVTLNTKGYYGHEIHYVRSQIQLRSNVDEILFGADGTARLGNPVDRSEKIRQTRLGYNFLLYMMPAGERWRPYITFGAETIKTDPPRFLEWTSPGGRNFGANYGAGIKLLPMKHALVRLDFRHILAGRAFTLTFPQQGPGSTGTLGQFEFSGGVSFAFGK